MDIAYNRQQKVSALEEISVERDTIQKRDPNFKGKGKGSRPSSCPLTELFGEIDPDRRQSFQDREKPADMLRFLKG